jgi:hypothetical protein
MLLCTSTLIICLYNFRSGQATAVSALREQLGITDENASLIPGSSKEGSLVVKVVVDNDHKKKRKRTWRDVHCCINGQTLFVFDLADILSRTPPGSTSQPSSRSQSLHDNTKRAGIAVDTIDASQNASRSSQHANGSTSADPDARRKSLKREQAPSHVPEGDLISLSCAVCDIAYDYKKRANVFRIKTVSGSEFLFQAQTREEMLHWITAVQAVAQVSLSSNSGMFARVVRFCFLFLVSVSILCWDSLLIFARRSRLL